MKKFLKNAPFLVAVGCLLVSLMGCSEKKEVLIGEREAILVEHTALEGDASLKEYKIHLPKAENVHAWPMASLNAAHLVPSLELNGALKEAWSASIGRGSASDSRLLNGPVVAEGKVFAVDAEGQVSALSLKTGEKLWHTNVMPDKQKSQPFGGGVAYAEGKIYVSTPSAEVVVLEASNGTIVSRFKVTAPVRSSPTIHEGRLYVITINNQIEALDLKTGEALWSHNGMIESAGLLGGTTPTVYQDIVIAPYTSGEVYALRADNGAPLWAETLSGSFRVDPVSSLFHIKARPVVYKGVVYIISHGGQTRAINVHSGQTLWSQSIGGIRTPHVTENAIFMITNHHEVVALKRETGKVIWTHKLPAYGDPEKKKDHFVWAGPLLVGDRLLVAGSNGQLVFLDGHTGQVKETLSLGHPLHLSPLVVDNTLIALSDRAQLLALRGH